VRGFFIFWDYFTFRFGCRLAGAGAFAIFLSRSSKAASSSSQPVARAASLNFADWLFVGDGLVFGFMIFTVEDIDRLRAGWCGPITVGELPAAVAKRPFRKGLSGLGST
jgi:hypothetical protein